MARETKEARMKREAQEELFRQSQEKSEYFPTLMLMLERACKLDFDLVVRQGCFILSDRTGEYSNFLLPAEYVENNQLESLQWILKYRHAEKERVLQLLALKQNALSKLTTEEIAALGIADRDS